MELDEEYLKIKIEIKEEPELDKEDQKCKETDYSHIKVENEVGLNNSYNNITSPSTPSFCSKPELPPDDKYPLDADKDCKNASFLWCLEEGLFTTVKDYGNLNDNEDKKPLLIFNGISHEDEFKKEEIENENKNYLLVGNFIKEECKLESICSKEEQFLLNINNSADFDSTDLKGDTSLFSNEDKKSHTTDDTSQENYPEIEEAYNSDVDSHENQTGDDGNQELSSNTTPSTLLNRKKYFKPLKYVCRYCGKRFPQSDILRYHEMAHTGQRPLECNFCNMRFIKKTSLKRHLQVHTGKKFACKICGKRLVTNYNLQLHMLAHENKRAFKCAVCLKTFNRRMTLYRHMRCGHKINRKDERAQDLTQFECDHCNKTFISKEYLKGHIELHMNENCNHFECNHCNKTFISKEYLKEHIKCKHMNENCSRCKICGIRCSNKYCLNHEKLNLDSFTCSVCKFHFKDRKLFKQHIENIHPTDKPYGCSLCDSSFKCRSNLVPHIEVHHNSGGETFVCNICKMSFRRKSYLLRHMKTHTQSDRKFSCDLCHIRCRSKTDMKRHLETHFGGGDKPHKCTFCQKSFSKKCKLERHLLVHSGERPYKCAFCDKTYKDEGSLKCHQNTHEGKTFTCAACGHISTNEHAFKRHVRQQICQKQKNFTCDVCGKILKSEKFLINHVRKNHKTHKL